MVGGADRGHLLWFMILLMLLIAYVTLRVQGNLIRLLNVVFTVHDRRNIPATVVVFIVSCETDSLRQLALAV